MEENKAIDQSIIILEHILESDPRTFKNQDCENAWLFDRVYDALKLLKQYVHEIEGKTNG